MWNFFTEGVPASYFLCFACIAEWQLQYVVNKLDAASDGATNLPPAPLSDSPMRLGVYIKDRGYHRGIYRGLYLY